MKKIIEEIIYYFKGGEKTDNKAKKPPAQTQKTPVKSETQKTPVKATKKTPVKAPVKTPVKAPVKAPTPVQSSVQSKEYIESTIKEVISEKLGVEKSKIKNENSLVDDLGADSLDLVELTMEFEEKFNKQIPDEDAEKIKTVQDAITYIEGKLQSGGSLDVLKRKNKSYNDALTYIMKKGTVGGAIEYYSGPTFKK